MYPILFKSNNFIIYSFGILTILGIAVGVIVLFSLAKRLKLSLPAGKLFDYIVYVLLSGIVGARVFYIIFHWKDFANKPWQIIFSSWTGGLSFYGGLIGGLLTTLFVLRKNKDKLSWLDIGFISTMFGLVLGMLGCFTAGSYYGKPTHLPWAVTYTREGSLATYVLNQPTHPTQIYEALVALFIGSLFLFLILKKKIQPGLSFFGGMMIYAFWRIINDYFFLGHPLKIGPVMVDSVISLLFIITCLIFLVYLGPGKKLFKRRRNG